MPLEHAHVDRTHFPHQLRFRSGPGQADVLVHLTKRGRQDPAILGAWIAERSASERLASIISRQVFWARQTYSKGLRAVCFSEASLQHLDFLVTDRGFEPWGIAVCRDWVYQEGGGPVWYVRAEEASEVRDLGDRYRTFTVATGPGNEWMHEREWRVPLTTDQDGLGIVPDAVIGVMIGDANWSPRRDGFDNPEWWHHVDRYIWRRHLGWRRLGPSCGGCGHDNAEPI